MHLIDAWYFIVLTFINFFVVDPFPCPDVQNTCEQWTNIALNKPTNQTSTYTEWFGGVLLNYVADLAVDGNSNTDFYRGLSCANTANTNPSRWTVNLGYETHINYIILYLRNSNGGRYKNMRVFVGEDLCTHVTISYSSEQGPPSPNPVRIEKCDHLQPVKGGTVSVEVDSAYTAFCEVQVWVCSAGWFGPTCERCGQCLDNRESCDRVSGVCVSGCPVGRRGPGCLQACTNHTYGDNCSQACGQCKDGVACDPVTGACADDLCQPGWTGSHCQEHCLIGFYGDNCSSVCGKCSHGDTCNHVNGTCPDGCQAGFSTVYCTDCPDGTYGIDCGQTCGNCSNDTSCDKVTGQCHPGCQEMLSPPLCTEVEPLILQPSSISLTVIIIISVLLVLLTITILLVVVIYMLKRKKKSARDNGQIHNFYDGLGDTAVGSNNVYDNVYDEIVEQRYANMS